jgi:uncharacterized protein (TIGR02453 family)
MAASRFAFPPDTLEFLADLEAHNTKAWFDANRGRYESAYVAPAKAFVKAIAPALDGLLPGIHAEPRVLGSIFRINRDTRFSQDKSPYKDHLDFWFWEGERKAAVSGLFLRIAPAGDTVGAGAHGFDAQRLARYRSAVADRAGGAALVATVGALEREGFAVGGETYARAPRGMSVDDARLPLLRHSALYVGADLAPALACDADLVPTLLRHWREFLPLHTWLTTHVQ